MVHIHKQPQIDGQSGWYEISPNGHRQGRQLVGHHEFDYVIIGAGFTGVSLAHRLSERQPKAKIAVVDALKVGQGTSGRNAGFIIDVPHNVDGGKTDPAHDQRLYRLNNFAIDRLRQFKDRYDIACDWQDAGKYMAAHESRNLSGLDHFAAQLKADGFAYEDISGEALSRRLGTSYYQRAIYTAGNILVNPAALICGLARHLPANVVVFEDSPVIEIRYGSKHHLSTPTGSIKAGFVVHAGNIFNSEFGFVKNRLVPVYTYASLTQPLDKADVERHFCDVVPWGLTSAHPAGTTVRFTLDRRIFIRNILRFSASLSTDDRHLRNALEQHRKSFIARFPQLAHVKFDYTWGGMIAVTLNQHSVFKQPTDNVMVLNGCNGVGVAKGTYLGCFAADAICGDDNADMQFIRANSCPSFIPPDPIRRIGAQYRLKKEQRHAGGDR